MKKIRTQIKMNINITSKHLQIDKANSRIMIVVATATIITIFSLVSSKTLFSQITHQRHVIAGRSAAVKQLKKNIEVADRLESLFQAFNSTNPNIIGGVADNKSKGPIDGDNARIALDALPSVYDYPALATSLEKILKDDQITGITITGTDESTTQKNTPAIDPKPVPISIKFGGIGNYTNVQSVIKDIERSIRPFVITKLVIEGSEGKMLVTIDADTYYQQAKSLDNSTKVVN